MPVRTTTVTATSTPQVLGRVTHPVIGSYRIGFVVDVPPEGGEVRIGDQNITATQGTTVAPGTDKAVTNDSTFGFGVATQVWYIRATSGTQSVSLTEIFAN